MRLGFKELRKGHAGMWVSWGCMKGPTWYQATGETPVKRDRQMDSTLRLLPGCAKVGAEVDIPRKITEQQLSGK